MGYQNDCPGEVHPEVQFFFEIFETEEVFWTKNRFSRPGYVLAKIVIKRTPHKSTKPDKIKFFNFFPRRPEKILFGDFFWPEK